jgi:hypothetical protein
MFQRVASVLGVTAVFLIAADGPKSQGLFVHEWGTFTSVAGADGSAIDWDSLGCPDDLPKFVNEYGYRGIKWRLTGTVRMETPVMYFYSPREITAHVTVQFPHGLITEWYPKARYSVFQDGVPLPANINGIDTSLRKPTGAIEWRDIKIQPGASSAFPVETAASRYYAARETDAAPITVNGEKEKFLFYRGVARVEVPLAARVASDGKVLIENRGTDPVSGVILFESRAGKLGYRTVGTVERNATADSPALDRTFADLQRDLETTLVAQGLFAKEAHAMVETWRDSWFEEGSRLLYIVPARAVDAMLPVQIEPVPERIARVFVGRIELFTPATEAAIKTAIARRDGATINLYRRFLGPLLDRIGQHPDVPNMPGFVGCRR